MYTFVSSNHVGEEIEDELKFNDEMTSFIMKAKKFPGLPKDSDFNAIMANPVRSFKTVKLPKISLKDFSGNPLEWTSFRDSFESAVNNNPKLSDVDKMNYLKGLLKDEAPRVIFLDTR